jgi:hypothetical protein
MVAPLLHCSQCTARVASRAALPPLFEPSAPPHSDIFSPNADSTPSSISSTPKRGSVAPHSTGATCPPQPPERRSLCRNRCLRHRQVPSPGGLPSTAAISLNPQSISTSSSYLCCRITLNPPPFTRALPTPQSAAAPPLHRASTSHRLTGQPRPQILARRFPRSPEVLNPAAPPHLIVYTAGGGRAAA